SSSHLRSAATVALSSDLTAASLTVLRTNIFHAQSCMKRQSKDSRILIHLVKTAYLLMDNECYTRVDCCVFVIILSHNISHSRRRVGHAGRASESRRQLVLAVALGARSAWSMASGGRCVAGRARVDHGCVRARVVGKRNPHFAAAW